MFYQHFPYGTIWGTMHWGHAVSDDLVRWEHQGIALVPSKNYDRNGVFSGSTIEKDGKMYLFYSAVRYKEEDHENVHVAPHEIFETSQAMIVSDDGFHFDNWGGKQQIIPVCYDFSKGHPVYMRDPKVWKEEDRYYMVVGSTTADETGSLIFYSSRDLKHWKFVKRIVDEQFGEILECPDLFEVDGQYVFFGSPMNIAAIDEGYSHHCVCALVDFDPKTCAFQQQEPVHYIDYGLDLYAVQTSTDEEGRRVMVGWTRMPKEVVLEDGRSWVGIHCQPRVVKVINHHLYLQVHPNTDRAFSKEISRDDVDFTYQTPFRIKTTLHEGEQLNIGGYRIWMRRGRVKTDRTDVFAGIVHHHLISSAPRAGKEARLDIFVSPNQIEVFINDGQYVITSLVYDLMPILEGKVEHLYTCNESDTLESAGFAGQS